MAKVIIGIGSNLGDRHALLESACHQLEKLTDPSAPIAVSTFYETDPIGLPEVPPVGPSESPPEVPNEGPTAAPVEQGKYLNAAALITTSLAPSLLLVRLAQIETACGRLPQNKRIKWGPRPMDLDILLYEDAVIQQPHLTIPHKHMHQRWFVLQPVCDIAPEMLHPLLQKTMAQLLAQLPDPPKANNQNTSEMNNHRIT